jgi:hypothetical protein
MLPHPPGSVVRMFTRAGDDRDGDFAETTEELRAFARMYRNRNVYIAPNPSNSTLGARHTAAEVTHWSYFLIDMDPICECPPDRVKKKLRKCVTCRGDAEPNKALDAALNLLGMWHRTDFAVDPPLRIDSGRGVQAWIRLADIILDDRQQEGRFIGMAYDVMRGKPMKPTGICTRSTARRVNGYWLRMLDENLGTAFGCRIDTSVSDLPRVMRCPGTINMKTGREASIIDSDWGKYYSLAQSLVDNTPDSVMVDPEPPSGLRAGMTWQEATVHLTLTAKEYLSSGRDEPGRHKVMWHTAKKLQEVGVTRAEARRALKRANSLRGEDSELPPDQIEHALNTAYGT